MKLTFDPFRAAVAFLAVYALVTRSFTALAVAVWLTTFSFEIKFGDRS